MMKKKDKKFPIEHFYFHLKDSVHEFTIGLGEIIKCLKFAEDKGIVPKLPDDWWSAIDGELHQE